MSALSHSKLVSGILEAECENLAWKLERANQYSVAELKQSQSAAARSRQNLIKAFLWNKKNELYIAYKFYLPFLKRTTYT